jgi:hypothetical protein
MENERHFKANKTCETNGTIEKGRSRKHRESGSEKE